MGRVDHCRSLLSYCRPCSYCALSPALLIVAIVVLFATLRYANTTPRGGRWAVTVLSVRARVPPSPAPPVAMLSILPPMIELGPNYRYGGAAKPAQAAQTWPDDCVAPEYCTRTYGPELYLRFMTNVTQLICSPPTTVVCASATELLPVCLLPPCRLSVVPDKVGCVALAVRSGWVLTAGRGCSSSPSLPLASRWSCSTWGTRRPSTARCPCSAAWCGTTMASKHRTASAA